LDVPDEQDRSNSEVILAAAAELREAAEGLVARADALEAVAATLTVPEPEPLEAPRDEEEANARIVALDLITRGVGRDEAEGFLGERCPGVDAASLLDRLAPRGS